jgi:hypothetical protein
VRVVLQPGVSSSVLRLQPQEFVPGILPDQSRLNNLCTMLIPDRQGSLAFFQERLIFFAYPCFDVSLIAHTLTPIGSKGQGGRPGPNLYTSHARPLDACFERPGKKLSPSR